MECLAYTLQWLPNDKHVQLLPVHDFSTTSEMTSDVTVQFGHQLMQGLDIDWDDYD